LSRCVWIPRWCVWQRFLLTISDHNRYLIQPLGNWFDISTWHHQGEWFIDVDKRTLLTKSGNKWFAHHRQGRRNSQYPLDQILLHATPTTHSKAQVTRNRSSLECTDTIAIIPTLAHLHTPYTLPAYGFHNTNFYPPTSDTSLALAPLLLNSSNQSNLLLTFVLPVTDL
jgi:hypothetical protein